MQIRISITRGRDAGQFRNFQLDDDSSVVIGRSEDTDLPLWDESASRRHAEVRLSGSEVVIRDLGSANGIHINGRQVRESTLRSGDRILIGESEIRFESGRFHDRPTAVLRPDESGGDYTIQSALSRDAVQLGSRIAATVDAGDQLENLLAFVEEVQKADSGTRIQQALLERTREAFGTDRAMVVPTSTGSGAPLWEEIVNEDSATQVSRSVVERVLDDRQALLVADTSLDPRTRERQSIIQRGVRSVMAVPISARDRVLGVMAIESMESAPFTESDLAFAATLGQVAGLALENAERLQRSRRLLDRSARKRPTLITEDPGFLAAVAHLEQFAQAGGPVLIVGETGSGKELVAHKAHEAGLYHDGPWIPVNCSAIPRELLESELFGHEKGAFTGATGRREGLFELADRGTLFLDEIGDLPLELQPKLLRVLETGEFFRVGGTAPVQVELLVVSATHRELQDEVRAGRFREDLLFRLGRFRVDVPPLRERPGDIKLIAEHFLRQVDVRADSAQRSFSEEAIRALLSYGWPGNVRELRNVVERAAVIATREVIEPDDFAFGSVSATAAAPMSLEAAEKKAIQAALAHTGGVKGEAAELLGIAWPTLRRKIRKYGLE